MRSHLADPDKVLHTDRRHRELRTGSSLGISRAGGGGFPLFA